MSTITQALNRSDPERSRRQRCPSCGVPTGLLRVEHASLSAGRTYDRFFCPSCCASTEVHGGSGSSTI